MQSDPFLRFVHSVIALALLALLAVQLGWLPRGEAGAANASDRYDVQIVRMGPGNAWLLRYDKATGDSWRIRFPAVGGGWSRLREADATPAGAPEPGASED